MAEKKEHSHKDHRSRLKSKVKKFGLECLEYHEILELLLTYTIPRKDTNPTAHELMNHFGSFANVVDAEYYDLLKVEGIGQESALFFNILAQFVEAYNKSRLESRTYVLNSTDQAVSFFRDSYRIMNNEFMLVACLGKNMRVRKTYLCKGKDETEITFDLRKIINSINDAGVSSVVLFHTHPNGSVLPSEQDVVTTQKFLNMCLINGISLNDHIILNESEHFSFKKYHLIDKMNSKYFKISSVGDVLLDLDLKLKKHD